LAETSSNPLLRPLPDGIVPAQIVARTEKRWLLVMVVMLAVMMTVIVATGIHGALHPSSNVEVIDPQTLHLHGEFVESNLGSAVEPDGSVTVRIVAEQYEFVPICARASPRPPNMPCHAMSSAASVTRPCGRM
jgi:cytochrome c oxidase subunit II